MRAAAQPAITLNERLEQAGLSPRLAKLLSDMPHRTLAVDAKRPFREPARPRDEVMFVTAGLLAKYKTDSSGRRQIVALRFPGDGILPRAGKADYGLQAIIRSEVMVGRVEDFNPIVNANPELREFFLTLVQRHASIGYEWLVNTGRRDSVARVAHLLCETAVRSRIDIRRDPLVSPFTQQQIADITGQTSVNVNRVFADLERQQLIRREGRLIFFLDWDEMTRVAEFQPDYLD